MSVVPTQPPDLDLRLDPDLTNLISKKTSYPKSLIPSRFQPKIFPLKNRLFSPRFSLIQMFSGEREMRLLKFLLLIIACIPMQVIAEPLFVSVKSTKLRNQPLHWAASQQRLSYGTKITALDNDNGWFKVQTAEGKTGFIHQSAVTEREIILKDKQDDNVAHDKSDVVIAGKGFSKEVEKKFASGSSLNFSAVNRMERRTVQDKELANFVKEGKLTKEDA